MVAAEEFLPFCLIFPITTGFWVLGFLEAQKGKCFNGVIVLRSVFLRDYWQAAPRSDPPTLAPGVEE